MKGLYFIAVMPRQGGEANQFNIQTGVVAAQLGETHVRLRFDGNKFGYSKIAAIADLVNFSFFSTQAEQQLAVQELVSSNEAPAGGSTPAGIEAIN